MATRLEVLSRERDKDTEGLYSDSGTDRGKDLFDGGSILSDYRLL